jgi:hypothetical protein
VNERERYGASENASKAAGYVSAYFFPLFRAVLREATMIAANALASCNI